MQGGVLQINAARARRAAAAGARAEVWEGGRLRGAFHQAAERPLAGFDRLRRTGAAVEHHSLREPK
jgi:hypothetical protein